MTSLGHSRTRLRFSELHRMLCAWQEQAAKLKAGGISREDYDNWRYHYPKFDTTEIRAKVPSQALRDAMTEAFAKRLKPND